MSKLKGSDRGSRDLHRQSHDEEAAAIYAALLAESSALQICPPVMKLLQQ